jgi:hypothetical protein
MDSNSQHDTEAESEVNEVADSLEKGQKALFNDRSRPLKVVDRMKKEITKVYRKRHDERGYYDIVVMEGNGTVYHLVWQHGSGSNPILRKRSEWTETETEEGEVEYDYSSQGDRIDSIEIIEETQAD